MERVKFKIVSSVEKVLPAKEPMGVDGKLYLTVLKGETVSFQAAYWYEGPFNASGNICVESFPKVSTRTRIVKLVPSAYPCHGKGKVDDTYLSTEPGMYPDLLCELENEEIPLVSGQWRSIWIDIETEKNTDAGEYTIVIKMEGVDCEWKTEVSLEVLDEVLPDVSIPHTEWFHSDCLAQYYGVEVFSEEYWKIVENYIKAAVKRGCTMILTPIFTPPLDTAVGGERLTVQLVDVFEENGKYTFGFDKFERWVQMCRRCGMKFFEISHLFTQWGAKYAPKIMGISDGVMKQLFGWETDATGNEYVSFLHTFLDEFLTKLEELGIQKCCYFHVSDEPEMSQIENYRLARKSVEEKLKSYPIIDALSDYEFYKEGLIQEPVCASDHIEAFLKDRPEKLWAYYCNGQCVDVSNRFFVMQGSRTRILGIQLYKYNIDGFLHWGYNFYNSQYSRKQIDPYVCTDSGEAFPSGDAFLVYPGKNGVPEESIRLMLMSEAMNDLAAMKLLEKIAGREAVLECLDEEHMGEITFSKYPKNPEYVCKVRERVNEKIKMGKRI